MSVRRPTARTSSIEVVKRINNKGIILYREDTVYQKKSLCYSKLKSIAAGKLKLPIPLKALGHTTFSFTVKKDGTLKYDLSL